MNTNVLQFAMTTKNVIILSDAAFINGGAVKVAIQSAIGLSKQGLNVIFLCAEGPECDELKNSSVKIVCLNQKNILTEENRIKAFGQGIWNRKSYRILDDLLKSFSTTDTVVHSHVLIKALSPSLWAVLSKYQFKVFITLHDYFLFCPNGGMYNYCKQCICKLRGSTLKCYLTNCDSRSYLHKLWRDIRQIVQKRYLRKISNLNIISISSLNRDIAYPYLNNHTKSWFMLHNPVEFNKLSPVNITQNDCYLFLGRLSPEKGIDMFCEAISNLGLKGLVLGDGELKQEYEKKYPHIKFVGWVSGKEKDKYIRRGKALVFPSRWYEGAPLTILEMKSYGIPCIVPDRCAASEEIEDGKTGFVFKTGDLESLTNCITKYENSDTHGMQKNITEQFSSSDYSLENYSKKLIEIYNWHL